MLNAQYEARLMPGPDQAVPRASGRLITNCGPLPLFVDHLLNFVELYTMEIQSQVNFY